MMKRRFRILLALLILLILSGYFAKKYSLVNIPYFSVPSINHVRIDFINKSNETIKDIILLNEPIISNLKIGESKKYIFEHSGEGVYEFTVEFESGQLLIQGERYIEGGYHLIEVIKEDTVISKWNLDKWF